MLPEYSIRLSKKAKKVLLKISASKGLEIIVPHNKANYVNVDNILLYKKNWIDKHLSKYAPQKLKKDDENIEILELRAVKQTWKINYVSANGRLKLITKPNQELFFMGDINNLTKRKQLLIKWLKEKAVDFLLPLLEEISKKCDLPFNKSGIGSQRTLWGSCNEDLNVRLNYKLLFLPYNLVEHIIIHELAHTKHLDHSSKFWALVEKYDPLSEQHKRQFRKAHLLVPDLFE